MSVTPTKTAAQPVSPPPVAQGTFAVQASENSGAATVKPAWNGSSSVAKQWRAPPLDPRLPRTEFRARAFELSQALDTFLKANEGKRMRFVLKDLVERPAGITLETVEDFEGVLVNARREGDSLSLEFRAADGRSKHVSSSAGASYVTIDVR